jgi:hypothetical protein
MLITTHIPPTLLSPCSELSRKRSSLATLPPIKLIPLPSHSELALYLQMRRSPNTQLHISFTLSRSRSHTSTASEDINVCRSYRHPPSCSLTQTLAEMAENDSLSRSTRQEDEQSGEGERGRSGIVCRRSKERAQMGWRWRGGTVKYSRG